MSSRLQIGIEQQRAVYGELRKTLLQQLADLHQLSIREFAAIFGISKSHAQDILSHEKMPSLELAIRISRYWEVSTDELFGWRVDDDGERRPLLIPVSGTDQVVRLKSSVRDHGPMEMVLAVVQWLRVHKKIEEEGGDESDSVHSVCEGGATGE